MRQIALGQAGDEATYADGGGGAVSFAVGSQTAALAANTVFLAAAGDTAHQIFDFAATAAAGAPATDENAALTISKATANFTAGNGIASIVVEFTIQATI